MVETLVATQGDENWVLSPDGAYIYVAGNDGYLRVFDAHTGESLHSVDVGSDLGAISLSPDGTRLAVVEEVPENVQQFQSWTENSADVSFYTIDLSTFGGQEHTYHVTAEGYTFADVTWSDNDTLQLSQNILPGWSGWAPLATVELATGALTEHSSYYSGLGTSASLLTIPDSTTVLLGQLGLSSAQYYLIAPDGNAIVSNGIYENDVYGYAGGIEAASGTTTSDRIIIVTGGSAHLYDGTMSYIGNLASLYPNLGSAAGVTFSADGQRLFFLDAQNQAVVVVDAYNYSLVATVELPGVIFETLQWSEEIVVTSDGEGIYYNTSSGIAYVSVDLPDLGTDGADNLSGTAADDIIDGRAGADIISGLAGDDWLIGGSGNDQLDGGDGFDIAAYETATAGVSVDLGIVVAQPTGGANSDTLVSIEGLSGSIYNDVLTGNAIANLLLGYDGHDTLYGLGGDDDLYGENGNDQLFGGSGVDWLFGDGGADLLDGGTGADRLEGGDGNDTYVVDDAGDLVLETATGGFDTMQVSNFSATIASSVEALIIVSGAVNATGDFVANSLTGSDQANVLSGLGGNDTLAGGAGDDMLIGGSGADMLDGGAGIDKLIGGAGDDRYRVDSSGDRIGELVGEGTDTVYASVGYALRAGVAVEILRTSNAAATTTINLTGNEFAQSIFGNAGANVIVAAGGNDLLDGGAGIDKLYGGIGDDAYFIDESGDRVIDNAGEGTDTVYASTSYALRAGTSIEIMRTTNAGANVAMDLTGNEFGQTIAGNAGVNTLYGAGGDDILYGEAGNDRLYGGANNDVLDGGSGLDRIFGGTGDDVLTGGGGADKFVFTDLGGTDRITDFLSGTDKIDLGLLDANTMVGGDQAFNFIGDNAFGGIAGQLRAYTSDGGNYLAGDVNGDGVADFTISLGSATVQPGDLIL